MKEKVEKVLSYIRPSPEHHGGNVELAEVDEKAGVVKVRLTGCCAFCSMAEITLKNIVETTLKKEIPEIKEIIAV